MAVLGYERYGVQGGDWGAIVAAKLGAAYPERVAGIHVNMLIAPPPAEPAPEDAAAVERVRHWRTHEDAYSRLQRTKPDSLTVAQSDSPAGLAAWIVEKFRSWSDCDGDVVGYFGRDTLLTNLMFYWAPASVASAARIYYESARDPSRRDERGRVEVPVAYAAFPHEIFRPPRAWAEQHYAIARWTEMPRGGHFAALEAPGAARRGRAGVLRLEHQLGGGPQRLRRAGDQQRGDDRLAPTRRAGRARGRAGRSARARRSARAGSPRRRRPCGPRGSAPGPWRPPSS